MLLTRGVCEGRGGANGGGGWMSSPSEGGVLLWREALEFIPLTTELPEQPQILWSGASRLPGAPWTTKDL